MGDAKGMIPGRSTYFGWDVAEDLEISPNESGYWVLDAFGGLHPTGSAQMPSGRLPYFGWDIARDLETK